MGNHHAGFGGRQSGVLAPRGAACRPYGWADTQAGVARIRWLAEHDVPTIHLAIGIAPLSVECDRIHVITDPAQALDQIAADTVAALRARARAADHNTLHLKGHHRMPNPNPALLPSPRPVRCHHGRQGTCRGPIERIALEDLELAPNPRKHISQDSIQSLAALLMRTGQLIPCIGHRPTPNQASVLLYDGQRRLLAAKASHELAGTDGFEGLAPVRTLIVLQLDHEPTPDEIRRIQAQANQREQLSLVDQQQQFADCWQARAGLPTTSGSSRSAPTSASPRSARTTSAGSSPSPTQIRERVAERPTGQQLSVTMANRLADMHEVAPDLTQAIAKRITSTDLHDSALRDLGAFVHRTIVEDEHTYAVRIDDGALLDAAEQIDRARPKLTPTTREQLAADPLLRARQARPGARHAHRPLQDQGAQAQDHSGDPRTRPRRMLRLRPPTRTGLRRRHLGRQSPVHDRPRPRTPRRPPGRSGRSRRDVLRRRHDSTTMNSAPPDRKTASAATHSACAKPRRPTATSDSATTCAPASWTPPRPAARAQSRSSATSSPTTTATSSPTAEAGQTKNANSQSATPAATNPDNRRHPRRRARARARGPGPAPRHRPTHRQLGRSLRARPRRHHPHQDARHRTHGPQARTTHSLAAHNPLRAAVWDFLRPMLSPRLAALHRDTFVLDEPFETTVELAAHRAESDLADLDLGDEQTTESA